MKNKTNNPLSSVEWTTCWMAVRYAMDRQSIQSASLPRDLLHAYWMRWTNGQKAMIARDLREHLEEVRSWNNQGDGYFGDKDIDHPEWMKFLLTLDITTHKQIKLIDGNIVTVFEYDGRFYPLDWWKGPGVKYVDPDAIEEIKDESQGDH